MPERRVALLLNALEGGGAERVFMEIARGLLGRGIAIDVVVVRNAGALREAIPVGAELVELGTPTTRTASAIGALRRYLVRRRPATVMSALDPTNVANVLVTRTLRPRIPSVVTQHNTVSMVTAHAGSSRERVTLGVARAVFRLASRVVAVSNGVADDMAGALRLERGSIEVVYNPVISPQLEHDARAPIEHPWLAQRRGPALLAVGRLTPQKDFATLLHALALLPADHRLVVLGDGELRAELTALADELGLRERVDLHGFVANPYPFFAACDVFVLSSRWEGLPTALIEALPFPCGIASTDCPSGPREILDGGRWGRLVPCGDPAALAGAITAEVASRAARPREAWRHYEFDYVIDRYVELLTDLGLPR